ncbi:uncharacterized protein LOC143182889 [Calliopsis andreniformis]|uniref:uncharacterized protein LOC143182889 n=1 Tax=Calliopsis andreniformis TaxID=337506 RepID=UPI003FCD9C04
MLRGERWNFKRRTPKRSQQRKPDGGTSRIKLLALNFHAPTERMNFRDKTCASRDPRGEPSFPDPRGQTGRIAQPCKQEASKHADALIFEKMQTKMRFLEDSNTVMQTRNQNLITENKVLTSQLEEERNAVKRLEKTLVALREDLDHEKLRVAEMKKAAEQVRRKYVPTVEANGTSTTNIISRTDRGVQIWAVCMGCQKKLEGCEKQAPTVVITKSELEVLEKDMQTLRDTIIAREEAWDKAMEREQNYRQQLTRLTTETITARHLSDTRYEELQALTKTLSEKEMELKTLQRETLNLNKLITRLFSNHPRQEDCQKSNLLADINEKDQRLIEDIVRRTLNTKTKQKPKSKSACSERTMVSWNDGYLLTPRDRNPRTKDQTCVTKEAKR